MGSGPLLDQFKSYAVSKKVNASFLGRVPYSEMVGTMCSCDAVVNPIRKELLRVLLIKLVIMLFLVLLLLIHKSALNIGN